MIFAAVVCLIEARHLEIIEARDLEVIEARLFQELILLRVRLAVGLGLL